MLVFEVLLPLLGEVLYGHTSSTKNRRQADPYRVRASACCHLWLAFAGLGADFLATSAASASPTTAAADLAAGEVDSAAAAGWSDLSVTTHALCGSAPLCGAFLLLDP